MHVSKALAVLSGDDAHDLFTRTFNPEMLQLQTGTKTNKELQSRASSILNAAAKKMRNPKLAMLALHVRLDAFTKVKKAINDMIDQLLQEKEDEIKKKDYCIEAAFDKVKKDIQTMVDKLAKEKEDEIKKKDYCIEAAFDKVKKDIQTMVDKLVQEKEDEIKKKDYCIEMITENEDHTTSKKRGKGDLETAIEDLKMTIEELTAKIEDLKQAIHEAELQLKRAGVDREKQNQEFKVVVADQRATQKLIKAPLS
jgi:chromosome segregation ATPase